MKFCAPFVLIGAVLLAARPSRAQDQCLTDAIQAYTKLKTEALLGAGSSVLSTQMQVGLRRMEEAFCFRVAFCLTGEPNVSARQIPYAVEFSRCLRDETLEKYNAEVK
jgi:hypothetical protein